MGIMRITFYGNSLTLTVPFAFRFFLVHYYNSETNGGFTLAMEKKVNNKGRMALNVARLIKTQTMPHTLHANRAQAFLAASPDVLALSTGVNFDPEEVQMKLVLQQLQSAHDIAEIASEAHNHKLMDVASEMVRGLVSSAPGVVIQVLGENPEIANTLVGESAYAEIALRDLNTQSFSQRSH